MHKTYRIFVVEDELLILESYKSILKAHGHQVAGFATDGITALQELAATPCDLVLMDINIPGKNGLEVVRELYEASQIPVIFVTGYYSQQLVDQATALGAFGFIVKPVDEKQLLAAIPVAMQRYFEYELVKKEAQDVKTSLRDRIVLEKAKGIIMKRRGLPEQEALAFLQQRSRNRNKKLVLIAQEIIDADALL